MWSSLMDVIKRPVTVFRYLPKSLFVNPTTGTYGGGFDDFKARHVDLHDVITDVITSDTNAQSAIDTYIAGSDQTVTGEWTFEDAVISEDLALTEVVTSPATSSSLTLVQKQLVHTVVGGSTEEIPINVPDNALLFSAEILVSTILAFTTGVSATATWTNSTQQIGSTGALAAKNSKVSAFYNANAESAIATGTPETITLTPNAGSIDSGVVIVIVRYWTLSGITNVA